MLSGTKAIPCISTTENRCTVFFSSESMSSHTKEDLTDDETFCLDYFDLSNIHVDEYHLACSGTEDAINIETAADHEDLADELVDSENPLQPSQRTYDVEPTLSALRNDMYLFQTENPEESSLHQSLLRKIIIKYFLSRTKQFIEATKDEIKLTKEKAHRKKIAKKSEKAKLKSSKLTIENICNDQSTSKKESHSILAG